MRPDALQILEVREQHRRPFAFVLSLLSSLRLHVVLLNETKYPHHYAQGSVSIHLPCTKYIAAESVWSIRQTRASGARTEPAPRSPSVARIHPAVCATRELVSALTEYRTAWSPYTDRWWLGSRTGSCTHCKFREVLAWRTVPYSNLWVLGKR